jgi:hypothetical protein
VKHTLVACRASGMLCQTFGPKSINAKVLEPTSIYACQDAAWMDEHCILVWVNKIFGPYLVANPLLEGMQPVLLLNSYRCHMMALVMLRIEAMGVHIIHIPGGCMGLTQPLDVGIN